MLTKHIFFITILFQIYTLHSQINNYNSAISVNICSNTITVNGNVNASIGDKVLIIQMKGAEISTLNDSNFGNISNLNSAGLYEINEVESISGNTITFKYVLANNYDPSGLVQLVFCPNYSDYILNTSTSAVPWNGSTGGIVFLFAQNTITLNNIINVSGQGFRGGNVSANFYQAGNCASSGYTFPSQLSLGAFKGEGISEIATNLMTGRGKLANGGGGGNNLNAGGGGGSNWGTGGRGGNEWSGCSNASVGGIGGLGLNYSNRLFLGGGGGGGHQNNSVSTAGGNGGGIVVIVCNQLINNEGQIISNGNSVTDMATIDAAGGGGSGGSILLKYNTLNSPIYIEAKGGNGGSANNSFTGGNSGGQCHGPGGGGGGGKICVSSLNNVQFDLTGGIAGTNINTQSNCYQSNYGAQNGTNGIIEENCLTLISTEIFDENSITETFDFQIFITQNSCNEMSSSIIFQSNNSYNYSWSHDSNNNSNEAYSLVNGTYTITISNEFCSMDTTVIIFETSSITSIDLEVIHPICSSNGSIQINNVIGGEAPYQYSLNGSNFSSINEFLNLIPGNYQLTVMDLSNCEFTMNIIIEDVVVDIIPHFDISSDCGSPTSVFVLNSIENGTSPYNITLNNDVIFQNESYTLNNESEYLISITDVNGCTFDSTFTLLSSSFIDSISITILDDFCNSNGGSIIINDVFGGSSPFQYSINNQEYLSSNVFTNLSGNENYHISVLSSNGCIFDTIVTIQSSDSELTIEFETVKSTCKSNAEIIVTSVQGGLAPYTYSFGDNNNFTTFNYTTFTNQDTVLVYVNDGNGCQSSFQIPVFDEKEIETIYIPNCFTPNDDNSNQNWFIKGNCIEEFECIIMNRWGNLIKTLYDIDEVWDGTYKGNKVQDGVYFYKVNIKYFSGEHHEYHGHITLLR